MPKRKPHVGWVCICGAPCSCDEWDCWKCGSEIAQEIKVLEEKLERLRMKEESELEKIARKRDKIGRVTERWNEDHKHPKGSCGRYCGFPR